MGVSIKGGSPKSSILMGFSLANHPFGGTPMETPTWCQPCRDLRVRLSFAMGNPKWRRWTPRFSIQPAGKDGKDAPKRPTDLMSSSGGWKTTDLSSCIPAGIRVTLVGCEQSPADNLRRKPQIRSQWPCPQTQTQWLHPAARRSMTPLNWNFEKLLLKFTDMNSESAFI